MKSVLIRLKEFQPSATDTELNLINYILENPEAVCDMSVRQLAQNSYSSASAVIRLSKDLGFRGFNELKKELIIELTLEQDSLKKADTMITKADGMTQVIEKVIAADVQSLTDTGKLLDPDTLEQCLSLLKKADTILLYGIGASYSSAKDLQLKLLRMNKHHFLTEDWHAQLLSAKNAKKNDLAIIFSYSGHTAEMIAIAKELKEHKTPIIAVTRFVQSPLQDLADHCLFTASTEAIVRSGAMSSRLSQLAIIDILYTALVNSEYDYALKQIKNTHFKKD